MQLPIITFIQTRLLEANPNFEVREGTAHYDLFIIPQQFMLQPLNDFMSQRRVGQSVRQMLLDPTPDTPTTFASTDVDDLASNVFVTRDQGGFSTGIVRVFYLVPKDLEFPTGTAQFTSGSLNFFNSTDFVLSSNEMALNQSGSLYFADIPIKSEAAGNQYNVAAGAITAILNDQDAVLVSNQAATVDGLTSQTNTQLLNSIPNAIAVRDLETGKGISAILQENFPFLEQIVPIGYGDPEMQRDILYNVHVGSKTDVYLKTPVLTTGSTTINGLVTDSSRKLFRSLHIEMARSLTDPDFPANTGTPSLVAGSVVVSEDAPETSASISSVSIPSSTGIDLTGKSWFNIEIDEMAPVQFNASGATVSQTQRFEIINAINAAIGLDVAVAAAGGKILLTSPTEGSGSKIVFNLLSAPISNSQNAAFTVFGVTPPTTIQGEAPAVYVEGVDYIVDYAGGNIYQTTFDTPTRDPLSMGRETITSGQTMIPSANTGQITSSAGKFFLSDSVSNAFNNKPLVLVRVGDEVTITSINGISSGTVLGIPVPSTFFVSDVVSDSQLSLSGFAPTGTTSADEVTYSIVSTQVVDVAYNFNPVSIDIGPQVLLADGFNRGIRPGRDAFTIKDVPFIKILSIQEVDPDTGEAIGDPLVAPSGYGAGGYGDGGYGIGISGDYNFFVNDPTTRFSVFEDSIIVFNSSAIGNSYTVTYLYNPELQAIHTFCRSDIERVTGADVLVKSFIPCFVDIPIGIRRNPANSSTPPDDALAVLVEEFVEAILAPNGLDASGIEALLEGQGLASVQTPFNMTGTVLNPDGSTTILQNQDVLVFPAVTLPSQTSNYTTARIVHFWAGNITCTEVS